MLKQVTEDRVFPDTKGKGETSMKLPARQRQNTTRLKNNAKKEKFSFSFAVTHCRFNPLLIA